MVLDERITILKRVTLSHSDIMLRSDGIVQINYAPEVHFTEKQAREWFVELEKMVEGKSYPILKVPGEHSTTDQSNRDFVAKGEGLKYSKAEAFVLKSMAHRIIGNFYMMVDKPLKPTKMFANEEDAVNWLYQFR